MEITQDTITFRGSKFTVPIDTESIAGLDVTSLKPPWLAGLAVNAIVALYLLLDGSIVSSVGSLLLANGLWLLANRAQKWMCIRYEDRLNDPKKAYFADGSNFGWSSFFGGTQKIHERLSGWLEANALHGSES